jgi:hypothetical protein
MLDNARIRHGIVLLDVYLKSAEMALKYYRRASRRLLVLYVEATPLIQQPLRVVGGDAAIGLLLQSTMWWPSATLYF